MARILIVDDDKTLCDMLLSHLSRQNHEATASQSLQQGLHIAKTQTWDIVLLDVQMPDGDGLDFLPDFVASASKPEVIIITGQGAPDGAEKAILGGAWNYIEKPHVIRDLPLHLKRALQYRQEKLGNHCTPVALNRDGIIGNSPAMNSCFDELAKASHSEVNVLVTGETGTGKELFAQAIHTNSKRKNGPFVVVDCASLPENLLESALFGHAKGAFTGADTARDGLIKTADKGTLFLDEVGELSPAMQKTFLRVLQEHSFRPLGSTREEKSDFRLLSATNRNIEKMAMDGIFRKDLLYRLTGINISLPTLQKRSTDIKDLVQHCADRLCKRYNIPYKGIAPDFIEALMVWDWPGNVRQLFQTIEHVFAGAIDAPTLFSIHLPQEFRVNMAQATLQTQIIAGNLPQEPKTIQPWRIYKESKEEEYIIELMSISRGDIKRACSNSGISRARLYQLLKKYSINQSG